ncbi:hypothetical protein [Pseudonocardia nigra]|uniref:hypothetical protein n=1 Tax=Pseudonocardia nigra TaxID=1921578 RepID=UPI001C5F0F96|nr:hypothetical protein [Pseudonocardia nigra]
MALLEVLAALAFAWLLLDEAPRAVQLVGGALILTGVVLVKLGDGRRTAGPPPELGVPAVSTTSAR